MTDNNKKPLLQELKDAFLEGYNSSRMERESSKNIVINPSQEELLNETRKFENEMLIEKISRLEANITVLKAQINEFIVKEKEKQEILIQMTTVFEEVLYSLEEQGILSKNELPALQEKKKKSDVMVKTTSPSSQQQGSAVSIPKKYDLN